MAKRFTDSDKWKDPWFCGLSPTDKLFWFYLLDNCDHAGIWQVNWPLVKFHLGKIYKNEELKSFEGRIFYISEFKWFLPKFLIFQYGTLNPENKAHSSVMKILEKEGALKGHICPLDTAQDMDKDMDKDKGVVRGEEKVKYLDFVFLSKANYDRLAEKLGITRVDSYIDKLNNYIGSKGKRYKSHYHTILSWASKDDGIKSLTAPPAPKVKNKRNADSGCPMCSGSGRMSGGTDCPCTQ